MWVRIMKKLQIYLGLSALYTLVVGISQMFSGLNIIGMSVYGLLGLDWQAFCSYPAFWIAFSIVVFDRVKNCLYRIIREWALWKGGRIVQDWNEYWRRYYICHTIYTYVVVIADIFNILNFIAMSACVVYGLDWTVFVHNPVLWVTFSISVFARVTNWLYRTIKKK